MGRQAARSVGVVVFAIAAVVMAAWSGAYWSATLDPVDATAGELVVAALLTAVLSAGFSACAWVLVRPRMRIGVTWAGLLVTIAVGFFVYGSMLLRAGIWRKASARVISRDARERIEVPLSCDRPHRLIAQEVLRAPARRAVRRCPGGRARCRCPRRRAR
ncbi:MAG: hypothetical protein R2755_26420 [Acidimicrobiales bacterium]